MNQQQLLRRQRYKSQPSVASSVLFPFFFISFRTNHRGAARAHVVFMYVLSVGTGCLAAAHAGREALGAMSALCVVLTIAKLRLFQLSRNSTYRAFGIPHLWYLVRFTYTYAHLCAF